MFDSHSLEQITEQLHIVVCTVEVYDRICAYGGLVVLQGPRSICGFLDVTHEGRMMIILSADRICRISPGRGGLFFTTT